ncbi:MAG TPA: retropepsin-like aspartic protease [Drouetiella sp.]
MTITLAAALAQQLAISQSSFAQRARPQAVISNSPPAQQAQSQTEISNASFAQTARSQTAIAQSSPSQPAKSQPAVSPSAVSQPVINAIPFTYFEHLIIIPVKVGDKSTNFILDTGAGVNVISQTLAEKQGFKPLGKVAGKRMSGQKLIMAQRSVPSFDVGTCHRSNLPMALWRLENVFPGSSKLANVDGLLSLEFFKKIPFTIDYGRQTIFFEDSDSLAMRAAYGVSIPIDIVKERGQTSVFMPLSFSSGSFAKVEVDTGSGAIILDLKYLNEFGVKTQSPDVQTQQGTDETGHAYVRYFTKLTGDAFLAQNRTFTQTKPKVQFQKIIYDGLVGDGFLSNYIVTFDLPNKRMIFGLPPPKLQ